MNACVCERMRERQSDKEGEGRTWSESDRVSEWVCVCERVRVCEKRERFRRRAKQSRRRRKGERQRGEIRLLGQTLRLSEETSRKRERKRPREQSERAREREVERERFVARAIPERFSPVFLDRELALHSAFCENSVVHPLFVPSGQHINEKVYNLNATKQGTRGRDLSRCLSSVSLLLT